MVLLIEWMKSNDDDDDKSMLFIVKKFCGIFVSRFLSFERWCALFLSRPYNSFQVFDRVECSEKPFMQMSWVPIKQIIFIANHKPNKWRKWKIVYFNGVALWSAVSIFHWNHYNNHNNKNCNNVTLNFLLSKAWYSF